MATDFFLKLDGIEGESTMKGHEKEIDVDSLSYGLSHPAQVGVGGKGLSGGKTSFGEISFTKQTDKSSPKLFQACGSGTHIATAVFSGQKQTGGASLVYFKVTLNDVIVTSFQNSGANGSLLHEALSFAYSKIQFQYVEQGSKGASAGQNMAGFDVLTNQTA